MKKYIVYSLYGVISFILVSFGCYNLFRSVNDKRLDKFNVEQKILHIKEKLNNNIDKIVNYLESIYNKTRRNKTIVVNN